MKVLGLGVIDKRPTWIIPCSIVPTIIAERRATLSDLAMETTVVM